MRVRAAVRFALAATFVIALANDVRADDDLARAHQLEAKLEYEQALAIVDGLLAKGGADPARVIELHVFAGKLSAGLDRARLAEDHYARALALDPTLTLPDGTSPKLTAPFAAAKGRTQPLSVDVSITRGVVTLAARDALAMVAGIAVRTSDGRELVERSATRLTLPTNSKPAEVAALDASGNRIWVGPPPAETLVVTPPPPPPPPPPRHETPAFYARPITWAAATGVALAFTGVAAWRFSVNQRRWNELRDEGGHEYDELYAVETRGRRWSLAANIGLGVAAATGIVTGIVWLRHLRPGPGAGVGAAARF